MDFCAIDWNELIKIVTPFVIAFAVYHVWHNQKGKEVIANEARELIKDLLEYITCLIRLTHVVPRTYEELVEEVNQIKTLKLKIFRSVHYFDECMKDESLEKILSEYFDKDSLVEEKMMFMSRNLVLTSFKKDLTLTEDKIKELVKVGEKLIVELKPYSIYKKRFKFK